MKRILIALFALVALAACSDTGPSVSGAASGTPTNSPDCETSMLSEALTNVQTDKFGQYVTVTSVTCEDQRVRVVQDLPVNKVQGDNPLTISRAYYSTVSTQASFGDVFIEVSNPSNTDIVCPDFEISFLDQQGSVIDFGYGHFLRLKPASYDYRRNSSLCIGPGERAILSETIFSEGDRLSAINLTARPSWSGGEYRPTGYQLQSIVAQQNSIEVQFTLDHLHWAQDVFPYVYIQDVNGYFMHWGIAGIDKTRVYLQPEAHVNLRASILGSLKLGDKIYFNPDLMQIEQRGLQADFVQKNQ
ncbi:lipoprotein [Salinibius halmophilus]|uniref:lipoprotein n=1 Tax=Salinibius halmophilus TaxID=1853216 RepID=UPI000E66CCC4|nr:lipoprotein [Salinibius halmophilus]